MLVSKRGVYYYDRINPPHPINYLWCINMNLFTNIKYYKSIKKSKKLHYDLSMIIAKW
jgi:hypothetical protein